MYSILNMTDVLFSEINDCKYIPGKFEDDKFKIKLIDTIYSVHLYRKEEFNIFV
jgi:hypothetical protein